MSWTLVTGNTDKWREAQRILGRPGRPPRCARWGSARRPVRVVEGRLPGRISRAPRGTNGFGWDAVFMPQPGDLTFGELSAAEKDARSHRRLAWAQLSDLAS